jgi:hypothetical protein
VAKVPEVGAVFAMPVGRRLEGVCRVIAKRGRNLQVAKSPWLGKQATAATLADPAARAILKLTHHSWKGHVGIVWVQGAPPKRFRYLGTLAPTAKDRSRTCNSYSGWEWGAGQVLMQWRWDHERAAVLAEDAKQRARDEAKAAKAMAKEAARKPPSLATLRRKKWFPSWDNYVAKRPLATVRKLLGDFAKRQRDVEQALANCVDALNALDAKKRFIFTIEREELHEALVTIAWAAGLDRERAASIVDKRRDW